jgi:glucose dehydrogenase
MPSYECDVCIIGGGITSAMLAQKLSELRPGLSIIVVEAGKRLFDLPNRMLYRQRYIEYGENAWPGDFIEDQAAEGIISRTMAVGGSALHWGGTCNRFSEEDLRLKSMYGLYVDWPLTWPELETYYCEAERRLGVSGDPSPFPEDRMSQPYPMKSMTLSHNLVVLKRWLEKSGIPFQAEVQAKNTEPYDGRAKCLRCNTCLVCPTGARYSPDFTFKRLLKEKKITLHDQTLIRKLIVHDVKSTVIGAKGVSESTPGKSVDYRASLFVVAAGYVWSSHLLLLSSSGRFPHGIANRSGLVGKYMCGHASIAAEIEMDAKVYPGMNESHGLISRRFFRRKPEEQPYIRNDLFVFESSAGHEPRLRTESGRLLLGDELMKDWRHRAQRGSARVRAYYDVHPDRESTLALDSTRRNRWGDPLPKVQHRMDRASQSREAATKQYLVDLFGGFAKADNGKILAVNSASYWDHPAGGCRMGNDPSSSVCDSYGHSHDHENLFVVGSPTLPNGGCTNGTLTFVALTLRSAERIAMLARPS